MIDVLKVGIKKDAYPIQTNQTFMTLPEYLKAAEKAIKFFAPKIKGNLVNELLKSDDAISNVAYAMMTADWKYKEGKGMTQYNYRNNYAFFAIRSYLTRKSKGLRKTGIIRSLDFDMDDGNNFYQIISDGNAVNPLDTMLEEDDNFGEVLDRMTDGTITEKQSKCIQMYFFDGLTYEQIGNKMGVTKERVRQNINNGLDKIRAKLDV
jgi:RNA polymerase sigma factor (sigma-70 family)